jgi:thioesterase domain-containing protein
VPVGVCGELYVGGGGVGRGYINEVEEGARSSFLPNPFSRRAGERLVLTGDWARYRDDGVIEFAGRADEQVKIRGSRIELGEIEACLMQHPGVRRAVVAAREDTPGQKRLVGYVTAREPQRPPNLRSLRIHVQGTLPEYMVPSAFVMLDEMPLTPNGKLDRKALPAPSTAAGALLAEGYEAPQGEIEQALAAIWQELLMVERIGRYDNFFELGGHSLLAVKLSVMVRERFGKVLPLATLVARGTIASLAVIVSDEEKEVPWSPLVAIRPGSRSPLFCIHPSGGNVLGYVEFASYLDPDLPVFGLQANGVVEGQEPNRRVPQMANVYLEKIRDVQPHGPYYLGGESFGGLVAYEIACQMVAAGEPVALVFLGDSWSCNVPQFTPWRYALAHVSHLRSLAWGDWCELFRRRVLGQGEPPTRVKRYTYADELHQRNLVAHMQAARDYRPQPSPLKVTLFRARKFGHETARQQRCFGGPGMCWPALASGGVEVHWLPDNHLEMMHGPNAHGFARLLQDCIQRAQ